MKKWSLIIAALFATFFFSCSSGHKISGINLNGNWVLNSITFDGLPQDTKFTATVFDDVPYSCFNGSTWSFPNNGNGSYTINSSDATCNAGTRNIYWSVVNNSGTNYLQFKILNGAAAKKVTSGYQMQITSVTATSMVLSSPVDFEGKSISIIYGFSKQ